MTANRKRKQAVRRVAAASNKAYQGTWRAMQSPPAGRPPGWFEGIVRETIRLAADLYADHEETSAGTDALETDSFERLQRYSTNPKRVALLAHLDALGKDDIYKLIAIMYAGRDKDSLAYLGPYVRRTFSMKGYAIAQMASKRPLAKYLSEGLLIARDQEVDIEAPLPG